MGAALVNTYILFRAVTEKINSITTFREKVALSLRNLPGENRNLHTYTIFQYNNVSEKV